jgi:hypothetical protein
MPHRQRELRPRVVEWIYLVLNTRRLQVKPTIDMVFEKNERLGPAL